MQSVRLVLFIAAASVSAQTPSVSPVPAQPVWQMQESGTTASLRGIDSVDGKIAWASGSSGTVLKTTDGGAHWQTCTVPDADKDGATLDFRGVQAWDAQTAIVMASGPGDKSRLYKTTDGCKTWTLILKNTDPDGFYDAIAFWNRDHGFLLGDPVMRIPYWQETGGVRPKMTDPRLVDRKLKHKRFLTITTSDGGVTWGYWGIDRGYFTENVADDGAAFAASDSASFVPMQINDPCGPTPKLGTNRVWFGVGGKGGARVLNGVRDPVDVCPVHPEDRAAIRFGWSEPRPAHIAGGTESSGVFSLAFRHDPDEANRLESRRASPTEDDHGYIHGVAVGGDYTKPNDGTAAAAWSSDSGWTWLASTTPPHGYRSTVQWGDSIKAWITAGTNGSDISRDDGKTWQPLDNGNWNALSLPFIVGPIGRIARLNPAGMPRP
jgi:hypothetical protein